MVFLNCSADELIQRYPGLRKATAICSACGAELELNRPFREKGYAGLLVEQCACGANENMADVRVTTEVFSKAFWERILREVGAIGIP